MEWKFDRTKLYLDYMKEGNTLCVPFNMMPTWWSICSGDEETTEKEMSDTQKTNSASSPYQVGGLAFCFQCYSFSPLILVILKVEVQFCSTLLLPVS